MPKQFSAKNDFTNAQASRPKIDRRRPFWLPASNYYVLSLAVCAMFFFLVWGVLKEGDEEAPWIPAGFAASFILGGAVFLREVVLRKARQRYVTARNRLDQNLNSVRLRSRIEANHSKFTLEKHASILNEIKKKSDAAKILNKLSEGHFDVFEICNEYLSVTKRELGTVGHGSPRIAAFRKGRSLVKELHKYHLLAWAEIESRSFTQQAKERTEVSERIDKARQAISILNKALEYYPEETALIDSERALTEFIVSIEVADLVEKAERESFDGNFENALKFYREALFQLSRGNVKSAESMLAEEKIISEIAKIREFYDSDSRAVENKRRIKNLTEDND